MSERGGKIFKIYEREGRGLKQQIEIDEINDVVQELGVEIIAEQFESELAANGKSKGRNVPTPKLFTHPFAILLKNGQTMLMWASNQIERKFWVTELSHAM